MNRPPEPSYKHRRLQQNDQIRILSLHPGVSSSEVFMVISVEKLLPNITPYKALSWQWGGEDETSEVYIRGTDVEDRYETFWVKPRLLAALHHLRERSAVRRLWVDAISIDQNDLDEKNSQVAMMTTIFARADEVYVWLGEEEAGDATAIKLIKELATLDGWNGMPSSGHDPSQNISPGNTALLKFLNKGWFKRRWVVQVRSTVLTGY